MSIIKLFIRCSFFPDIYELVIIEMYIQFSYIFYNIAAVVLCFFSTYFKMNWIWFSVYAATGQSYIITILFSISLNSMNTFFFYYSIVFTASVVLVSSLSFSRGWNPGGQNQVEQNQDDSIFSAFRLSQFFYSGKRPGTRCDVSQCTCTLHTNKQHTLAHTWRKTKKNIHISINCNPTTSYQSHITRYHH